MQFCREAKNKILYNTSFIQLQIVLVHTQLERDSLKLAGNCNCLCRLNM